MIGVIAHGSGIDDLLIPLLTVGAVAYYAFRPRLGRRGGPAERSPDCDYCGTRLRVEATRCPECGFGRARVAPRTSGAGRQDP